VSGFIWARKDVVVLTQGPRLSCRICDADFSSYISAPPTINVISPLIIRRRRSVVISARVMQTTTATAPGKQTQSRIVECRPGRFRNRTSRCGLRTNRSAINPPSVPAFPLNFHSNNGRKPRAWDTNMFSTGEKMESLMVLLRREGFGTNSVVHFAGGGQRTFHALVITSLTRDERDSTNGFPMFVRRWQPGRLPASSSPTAPNVFESERRRCKSAVAKDRLHYSAQSTNPVVRLNRC